MTYKSLILKVLAVTQTPEEDVMERFLQTMAALPEPEDELDKNLRLMLVDMAVKEYLGTCDCLDHYNSSK